MPINVLTKQRNVALPLNKVSRRQVPACNTISCFVMSCSLNRKIIYLQYLGLFNYAED